MKVFRRGMLSLCFLGCALLISGCDESHPQQRIAKYEIMTVMPTDRVLTDAYPATIRGRQDVEIFPQINGTLTEICVSEGEKVKKGQPLFIIDQVPYKAALQTASANVSATKAALATAMLSYESKKELYRKHIISDYDLNTAKNSFAASKALLQQAESQETIARNNLSYTIIKSPTDGLVGTLPFRIGALVGTNMAKPLTTISDNSEMYVYFSITEKNLLAWIRKYGSMDDALKALSSVSLQLSDRSEYGYKGKVESISGVIDMNTGTASLRAVFPNPDGQLYSGSTGNILVPTLRKAVLVIPRVATFEVQDKVYVYKVIDGKARSARVEVTRVNGGQEYIVESGLIAGESIIRQGAGILKEGTSVKETNVNNQTDK